MASDGSSAGPSASGESPRSLTDLKGIVKESLRELLHEEPALFASRTDHRPPGSSGEDAPGGEGLGAMPDAGSVDRLGLGMTGGGGVEDGGEGVAAIAGGGGGSDGAVDARESSSSKSAVGKPFILSEGLPPVPHKLVSRILRGEYVDMAELLRDNLEAQRRSSSQLTGSSSSGPSHSRSRREISDLLSWVQCFGTYVAIVTSKQPERMCQLLPYQTLMVREARRCGGKGWLAYDFVLSPAGRWERQS